MGKSRPVVFGQTAARQIIKTVRRVEGEAIDAGPASYAQPSGSVYLMPASVTTAIPTGSLGSPSTAGRISIYRDDSSGGLVGAETGQQVNNYHTLSASIAIGKTVTVYWRAGVWWLVASDC
jgi:hypothetical protein